MTPRSSLVTVGRRRALAPFVVAFVAVVAIAAWLSALAGISFVRVDTEIEIDAPPESEPT